MKFFALILNLLFFQFISCSLNQFSEQYTPEFLKPIDALLYTDDSSKYIFFAEYQKVLITRSATNASGVYKLSEATMSASDTVSYRLQGTGNYNNSYLALRIITNNNTIPQITLSIQISAEQAINALHTTIKKISPSETRSTSLDILTAQNPWVRTSRSGIFNPNDTENWTFEDFPIGSEIGLNTGRFILQKNSSASSYYIQFKTNLSPTQSIYSYQSLDKLFLLGVSIDLSADRLRANFVTNEISGDSIASEVNVFANSIKDNFRWEFGVQNDLQTPNGSLNDLNNKLWIKIDSKKAYNPQNAEIWSVSADKEVITVYHSEIGVFTTDVYVMQRSTTYGIFQLQSENKSKIGRYNNKFFGYVSIDPDNMKFVLGDSEDEVKKKIEAQAGENFLITTLAKQRTFNIAQGAVESKATAFNSTSQNGRSGLGTIVSGNKIYVFGGYSTPSELFSTVPQYKGGLSRLPNVERNVYTIENLDKTLSAITFVDGSALLPGSTGVAVALQQARVTKITSIQNNDTLYAFGASAVDNQRMFLNNFGTSDGWSDRVLNKDPVTQTFQHGFYSINNQIFLAGGTKGLPSNSAQIGQFTNFILNSFNGSSWNVFVEAAQWDPRTLPNVFAVENELILVGGYTNNEGTPDPVNDVWSSSDGGKTWRKVHTGEENGPPKALSSKDGLIPGTVYGGIIFMLDPNTRELYYSIDRGITWRNAGPFARIGNNKPLFGASLAVYDNILYLIGGQTTIDDEDTDTNMEKNIYRIPINFDAIINE